MDDPIKFIKLLQMTRENAVITARSRKIIQDRTGVDLVDDIGIKEEDDPAEAMAICIPIKEASERAPGAADSECAACHVPVLTDPGYGPGVTRLCYHCAYDKLTATEN